MIHDTRSFLGALRLLQDEGPALLPADEWATLDERLEILLRALQGEELSAQQFPAQVLRVLRAFPAAHDRFLATLEAGPESTLPSRGWPPLSAASRLPQPEVTRQIDLAGPGVVRLDSPRFLVVLRLRLPQEASPDPEELLTLRAGRAVQARLYAPDFEVLNAPIQETGVPQDQDSTPIVFDLRPIRVGAWPVTVDLYQDGHPLGSASLSVEVVEQVRAVEAPSSVVGAIRAFPRGVSPDRILRVSVRQTLEGHELRYALLDPQGGETSFQPVTLPGPLQAHIAGRYQILGSMTGGTGAGAYQADRLAERRLRAIGQDLWLRLIPSDFRRYYLEHGDAWRDTTLLVMSDEPWIPWELIWPRAERWEDDWEADGPWCLSMRLTRWLRRERPSSWSAAPTMRLPLETAALITPTDDSFPCGDRERERVLRWMRARGVKIQHVPARLADIHNLLKSGGYDWVHICAHATLEPDRADLGATLSLEEGASLLPLDLVLPEVAAHVARRHPAFVLNACTIGRGGLGLGGLDGWPGRLVQLGAGMVIGAMWPILDEVAARFVGHLYKLLGDGMPLGEAVRKARIEYMHTGDATWLAYTVYGHPNATIALPCSQLL